MHLRNASRRQSRRERIKRTGDRSCLHFSISGDYIRSVKNTQQITRAMKFASAARLRRAQESALAARPAARDWSACAGLFRPSGRRHGGLETTSYCPPTVTQAKPISPLILLQAATCCQTPPIPPVLRSASGGDTGRKRWRFECANAAHNGRSCSSC